MQVNQKQVILVKPDPPLPPFSSDFLMTILNQGGQPVAVIIAMSVFAYIIMKRHK